MKHLYSSLLAKPSYAGSQIFYLETKKERSVQFVMARHYAGAITLPAVHLSVNKTSTFAMTFAP